MKSTQGKVVVSLVLASVVCLLAVDFAEARRGGGGRGGGHSMTRGGPAASGSMHRSQARPQRSSSRSSMSNQRYEGSRQAGSRDYAAQRPEPGTANRDNRPEMNQDRLDQRQDNIDQRRDTNQDRYDQRQENINERQDFAKEVHNDREEWYEDRWRGHSYVSVSVWGSMGCSYRRVVVGGVTYYDCNGVRYERVYRGSEVVYVVVN